MVKCEEVDIKIRARLMPGDDSLQMFDQGDRRDNNGKRSIGIFEFTEPKILNQGFFKNWMKRPGDNAEHRESNAEG